MNLYDQLEKEMWNRDSLKGAKDAADLFQQTMEGLKTSATDTFQDQIDETSSLSGTDAGCAGSWESDFYNRYVAPYPSPQREKVYNEYVKRYNRRFERCKSKRASWLEDDKDKIEKYYDNQLEDIEDIQKQIQGELGLHSKNISDLQRRINALSQNLAAALCDIDVHWNAFIQYLDSNTVCIKCGKVYYTKPPDLQLMDSCLNNIYDKLRGKIRDLRNPDDQQELQAQADEYFPFDELMKEKDKLDSLKSAFQSTVNQWNQSSSLSKMVHPCCQSLISLAGGRYLYGHQNKPFRNESTYGQRLGLGNAGVVAVPKNPQQMQNPDFRRQYYKDKRGFYKQRYELSKQIDKSIRNLKNGHSDGRSFIHGLKDDEAVRKHGMAKAHPYHKSSRDSIQDALEELLYKAGNCYDEDQQNQRHKEYLTLHHKCFNFRQCLEILDREYQYYRDSLGRYKNALEDEISYAEKNLNKLKGKVERLRERISGLNQSIQNLQNQLAGVTDNSARTDIQNRINNLPNERNDISRKLNLIENDLPSLERKLSGLKQRSAGLAAAMNPRPVASIGDCEDERQSVQQARQQQRNDAHNIHGEASNASQEISGHLTDASGISDDISDAHRDGTAIGRDIEDQLEEERQRAQAARLRKEREIKGICAKLLAEYYDANSPAGSVFDSLAVAYEFLSGQIDQIPGGLSAFSDKMKEFKAQIDEAKETIEDIVTILSGVHDSASNEQRTKAFAKVMKYAAEFGEKVPGFGEMVGFYAKAYEASIAAIYKIMDDILAPLKEVVDNETRVVCPNASWKGKTLNQIVDQMWKQSTTNNTFNTLSKEQVEALEKYYKEKAKTAILNCCLEKLGE
jgi:predicted  nucleic acid-binding Zn-ribbon protein